MKRIIFNERNRSDDLLHIEVPGGIVNIRVRLCAVSGHDVTSIEILPDRTIGKEWDLVDGDINNRLVRRHK